MKSIAKGEKVKRYNIIVVYYNDKILMCKRKLEPFKGKLNLVGGKIEDSELSIDAAYRELYEETGIESSMIKLRHFMNFTYHYYDIDLEVYAGKLKQAVELKEEVNELLWVNEDSDFFGSDYAGDGNIGHIIRQISYEKDNILS